MPVAPFSSSIYVVLVLMFQRRETDYAVCLYANSLFQHLFLAQASRANRIEGHEIRAFVSCNQLWLFSSCIGKCSLSWAIRLQKFHRQSRRRHQCGELRVQLMYWAPRCLYTSLMDWYFRPVDKNLDSKQPRPCGWISIDVPCLFINRLIDKFLLIGLDGYSFFTKSIPSGDLMTSGPRCGHVFYLISSCCLML